MILVDDVRKLKVTGSHAYAVVARVWSLKSLVKRIDYPTVTGAT